MQFNLFVYVIFSILIIVSASIEQDQMINDSEKKSINGYNLNSQNNKDTYMSQGFTNMTYFERGDNLMRIPLLSNYKHDKKTFKKNPKRTIQKIIKRNKNKSRKVYINPATKPPRLTSLMEKIMIQKVVTKKMAQMHTTQSTPIKKTKRYPYSSIRTSRFGMPNHRLINVHERIKRNIRRDNVLILKDLDEMEFLNNGKDYDVVKTHMQNYCSGRVYVGNPES